MSKVLTFLLLFTASSGALSDSVVMDCKGVVTAPSIQDSQKRFDLEVGVDPLVFSASWDAFQVCMADVETQIPFVCDVDDKSIRCRCDGGKFMFAWTHIIFSRYSGSLRVTSKWVGSGGESERWRGSYQCSKVSKLM